MYVNAHIIRNLSGLQHTTRPQPQFGYVEVQLPLYLELVWTSVKRVRCPHGRQGYDGRQAGASIAELHFVTLLSLSLPAVIQIDIFRSLSHSRGRLLCYWHSAPSQDIPAAASSGKRDAQHDLRLRAVERQHWPAREHTRVERKPSWD
jgi:hypothetical protein